MCPHTRSSCLSLWLGTRWLQGDGGRTTLVASLVVGLIGVSIREFALAGLAAILVAAWARNRAEERVWLAGVSGVVALMAAGILEVSASMSGRGGLSTPGLVRLILLGPAFATFAAILLPAIVLGVGRRIARVRPFHLILGAALVSVVFVLPSGPMVGQLWMANGLVGNALLNGTRSAVIGAVPWALSELLAVLAAVLLMAVALMWAQGICTDITSLPTARRRALRIARSDEAPLVLFLFAYAAELAALVTMSYYPLDRYLYPMVPAAAILLLRGPTDRLRFGRRHAFAHAALAWLGVSAFVVAANSFAYDSARHRAGEAAVALGYDARTVDAGYEWVGYHSSEVGNPASGTYGLMWYDDGLMAVRPCAVVANSPLSVSPYELIRIDRSAYRQYLLFGSEEPLYLYGAVSEGCPPLPAAETP